MTKTADAIEKMTAPRDQLTSEQCIAIYDAVTRANFTRDVKTTAMKVNVVRRVLQLPDQPENRVTGKAPPTLYYWNGLVFVGGKQVKAFIAARSRADAARVLLEAGIHGCSQRYIKEFFSTGWPPSVFSEIFPKKATQRGVWLQLGFREKRYERQEL